jgi:hypothetical protein
MYDVIPLLYSNLRARLENLILSQQAKLHPNSTLTLFI